MLWQHMSFTFLLGLLIEYKYFILFPAMILEGPTSTILASFLSSPAGGHIMDVYTVFIIAVIADITGDTLYYLIGRLGKGVMVERYPKRFSISPLRFSRIEDYFKRHGAKTVAIAKVTHSLGWPAMVGAGSSRMPYSRFLSVCTFVSIGKSAVLVSLGYFYGKHYESLIQYIGKTGLIVSTIVIITIIFILLRRRERAVF